MFGNVRLRLVIVVVVWLATVVAITLWVGGKRQPELAIAAGSQGSETYRLAVAIAEELNESDSNLHLTVFETGGSVENLVLLARGQVDLAMTQSDLDPPDVAKGVALLYLDAYHLLVRSEAKIGHFAELTGKRVAIPLESSAQHQAFWFTANHYGLGPEDMVVRPMSSAAANFAMLEGQVDAVFRVRAPGNASIRELIQAGDIHILPINQAEALHLQQPALNAGVIPKGSYRGFPPLPEEHLPTAVAPRLLVAHQDLPPILAYRLTRSIFESRADLVMRFPLAGQIMPPGDDADSAIPAHPGARRYFDREKPGWLSENARLVAALSYVLVLVGSGFIAVRSRWMRSRRLRMGGFNERLMEIAARVRDNHNKQELLASKNALLDILGEVVNDLDADRVSQEEFEHFSFTWQAVDALVRDQLSGGGYSGTESMA